VSAAAAGGLGRHLRGGEPGPSARTQPSELQLREGRGLPRFFWVIRSAGLGLSLFFFVLLSLPHPAAVRPDAVERVAPGAGFRAKLHRIPAVRAAVPARCPVDLHKRPPPFSHGHIPAGMLGELLLKTVHGGPLLPPPVGCGGAVRLSTVPNLRTPRDTPSIPGSPGRRSD
jgi:hypothetical protein